MAIGDGFRATVAGWSKPRRTAFAIGVGGFVMAGAMWGASLKIERDVDKVSTDANRIPRHLHCKLGDAYS